MPKTALVVDDSKSILSLMRKVLDVAGYNVITASSGDEGLQELNSGKQVDIVITDLNMPNMDGFELIKAVRENKSNKNIPIIILSSLKGSEEIEKGLKVGANSYMVKPFDPKRIQYEVAKYIN